MSGNFTKGYYFYTNGWKTGSTVFFDALGYRDSYNGAVVVVGGEGYFWSAGASSKSNGRYLCIRSGLVDPQRAYDRSFGFSVRSVKE